MRVFEPLKDGFFHWYWENMRIVTNEELINASKNVDFIRVMRYAVGKNKLRFSRHFLNLCLWDSLRRYEPNRGMKFTTYLYKITRYKVLGLNSKRKEFRIKKPKHYYNNDIFCIDILNSVSNSDAQLIVDRFILDKTLNEMATEHNISISYVKKKVDSMIKRLARIMS